MKIWVHAKEDLDDEVFLEDELHITIELPRVVTSSEYQYRFSKFTDVEEFRKEVAELLIKKYHFNVLTETIDGKEQKGWTTDRDGSPSIYFNTFYDLKKAKKITKELGFSLGIVNNKTKVKCFVHLSISDHSHADAGDVSHKIFIDNNLESHTKDVPDIDFEFEDEHITISQEIYRDYQKGLEELEYKLKDRIRDWVKEYNTEFN